MIVYLLIICLYVIALKTYNYERLIQSSIIFGISFGFYSFYKQRDFSRMSLIIFTFVLPIIVLFIESIIVWRIPNILLISTLFIAYYVPALFGALIYRININNDYKWIILVGIIFTFLSGMTRKFNHGTSATITIYFAVIAMIVLYKLLKNKSNAMTLSFISIYILLNVLFGTFPEVLQIALLVSVLFLQSYITLTFLSKQINLVKKTILLFTITAIIAAFTWFGQENYEMWLFSKIENESVVEKVPYSFIKMNNEQVSTNQSKPQHVVVLFWSKQCSNCKKEFPYFSKLAESYSGDSTKIFIAAFLSNNDKDNDYFEQTTQQTFSFEWAKTSESKTLMNSLKLKGTPHFTIFNEKGEVKYNGIVSNRPWIWVNRPSSFF